MDLLATIKAELVKQYPHMAQHVTPSTVALAPQPFTPAPVPTPTESLHYSTTPARCLAYPGAYSLPVAGAQVHVLPTTTSGYYSPPPIPCAAQIVQGMCGCWFVLQQT